MAAILFLGPSGFGRASVGRMIRGSGLGWLLRMKSPMGSSPKAARAAGPTGVIAIAAPAAWRKLRRDGQRPSAMSRSPESGGGRGSTGATSITPRRPHGYGSGQHRRHGPGLEERPGPGSREARVLGYL